MVRLRLKRGGSKKRPFYRVVAVDSRRKRDGSAIEILGFYDPVSPNKDFKLDSEKVIKWYNNGARPSETVYQLMKRAGIVRILRGEAVNRETVVTNNVKSKKEEVVEAVKEEITEIIKEEVIEADNNENNIEEADK